MTFFTDERHAKARDAAGKGVLYLFENEKKRIWREDIDRRLGVLSDHACNGVCRNLERAIASRNKFIAHYHELVMGSLLVRAGFQVEYEPRIGVQTPDWRITDASGVSFIVEVLERRQSDQSQQRQQFCHAIQQQLASEAVPYWIEMEWDTALGQAPTPLPSVAEAVDQIRTWLRSPLILRDEMRVTDCALRLDVWRIDPSSPEIVWTGPSETLMPDPKPLRSIIAGKVEKYRAIADTCSFAVAVVLQFASCLEAEDLVSVLAGADGLFKADSALSGCFNLDGHGGFDWTACFIANRGASLPIADLLTRRILAFDRMGGGGRDETR